MSGGFHRINGARKSVEVYDAFSNKWSKMPCMVEERFNHASVSYKNKIIMIGGAFYRSIQCEMYDSFSETFVRIRNCFFEPGLHLYKQYVMIGTKISMFQWTMWEQKYVVFDIEKEEFTEEKELNFPSNNLYSTDNLIHYHCHRLPHL